MNTFEMSPPQRGRGVRYFAFCQGDLLLTEEGAIPQGESPSFPCNPWNVVTRIPLESPYSPCSAFVSTPLSMGEGQGGEAVVIRLDAPVLQEGFQMMPLRQSFDVLSAEDYQLAGKCAELLYFDQNSKFCGCCGAPMKWQDPISKKCQGCGKELWPPLAIATIVRVTRTQTPQPPKGGDMSREGQGDNKMASDSMHEECLPLQGVGGAGSGSESEILMVQARNFRTNHYGLVAGFVETGETLEQCVERELWEETHIKVKNIKYFGSQPWPYPCGLMVGFTADYVEGDIQLQKAELTRGGWFTRDNLPPIPGKASIARQLIDDWLKA